MKIKGPLGPTTRRILAAMCTRRPSSAYDIRITARVASGSAYSLLLRLEEDGLAERTDERPPRWKATPKGRRILKLSNELAEAWAS